jgi:hypothetical protein
VPELLTPLLAMRGAAREEEEGTHWDTLDEVVEEGVQRVELEEASGVALLLPARERGERAVHVLRDVEELLRLHKSQRSTFRHNLTLSNKEMEPVLAAVELVLEDDEGPWPPRMQVATHLEMNCHRRHCCRLRCQPPRRAPAILATAREPSM